MTMKNYAKCEEEQTCQFKTDIFDPSPRNLTEFLTEF